MSAIADLVTLLLSGGIPPETLAKAIELANQHANDQVEIHLKSGGNRVESAHEKRKKWDRDYRRRKVENRVESASAHIDSLSVDSEERQKEVVARARGTRLPDGWAPNADGWKLALGKLGTTGFSNELDKFRDYWRAQPGQRGVKLDWNATWRNWIRNAGVPRTPVLPFNGRQAAPGGFDREAYVAKRDKRIAEQMALREQLARESGAPP